MPVKRVLFLIFLLVTPLAHSEYTSNPEDGHFNYWGFKRLRKVLPIIDVFEIARTIEQSPFPNLLKTTITIESSWRPHVISEKNAYGLCQIRLIAAKDISDTLTINHLKDPITNVKVGNEILIMLMNYYNGDRLMTIKGYQRGRWHPSLVSNPTQNSSL